MSIRRVFIPFLVFKAHLSRERPQIDARASGRQSEQREQLSTILAQSPCSEPCGDGTGSSPRETRSTFTRMLALAFPSASLAVTIIIDRDMIVISHNKGYSS